MDDKIDEGRSKGGRVRAEKLTKERQREIAAQGARARWREDRPIKATHDGVIRLGDKELACANLPDGRRVISEAAMMEALKRGYSGYYSQRDAASEGAAVVPRYLSPAALKPFIPEELSNLQLVHYIPKNGTTPAKGVNAEAVPQICEAWLRARDARKLKGPQLATAAAAEIIMRGLARVGITALIDEATGYQAERVRDELQTILQAYIAKELLQWTKKFPDEFFRQVYRLQGWEYKEGNAARPGYVGTLINRYVYERLPPGVLDELRKKNPPVNGRRQFKHFQFLTEQTGHPHLDKQIASVTTLMRAARNKGEFSDMFLRAYPLPGDQTAMVLDPDDTSP